MFRPQLGKLTAGDFRRMLDDMRGGGAGALNNSGSTQLRQRSYGRPGPDPRALAALGTHG
jgi:hypothetical protein